MSDPIGKVLASYSYPKNALRDAVRESTQPVLEALAANRKAIGITFTEENVVEILSGRKTQTRRLLSPQPTPHRDGMVGHKSLAGHFGEHVFGHCMCMLGDNPWGKEGDRLWVREGWGMALSSGAGWMDGGATLTYRADGEQVPIVAERFDLLETVGKLTNWRASWRSPRFMPRWASRLTLELTEVRIERLQDISKDDAIAEGLDRSDTCWSHKALDGWWEDPRDAYCHLWDSIHGPGSWNKNPWVWTLTFKRLG